MVLSHFCQHYNPICHGKCCEESVVYYRPHSPALIRDMQNQKLPFEVIDLAKTWDGQQSHMGWRFKCRNYVKETGLCADYDNRPKHPCKKYICEDAVRIIAMCCEPIEDLPW